MKKYLPYVGPLIGLAGVSLALYFHAQSIQERVPTFYVGPQRAVIVDARGPAPSDLEVLYRKRPVGSTVIAVTIYVWNDGKLPIRAADILGDPIGVALPAGAEILEGRVLKASRGVCRFVLGQVNEQARNSIPITFDILEHGDGAAIQLIYTGTPEAEVIVTGTIVGAGSPRLLRQRDTGFTTTLSPRKRRRVGKGLGWTALAMGLAVLVYAITRIVKLRAAPPYAPWRIALVIAMVLSGVLYAAMGGFLIYTAHISAYPGVPLTIWADN